MVHKIAITIHLMCVKAYTIHVRTHTKKKTTPFKSRTNSMLNQKIAKRITPNDINQMSKKKEEKKTKLRNGFIVVTLKNCYLNIQLYHLRLSCIPHLPKQSIYWIYVQLWMLCKWFEGFWREHLSTFVSAFIFIPSPHPIRLQLANLFHLFLY